MRIAIHDISQEEALRFTDTVKYIKNGKEKTKSINLDATDLLIIDWFAKFYPNMQKAVIDGKEYGWIKRSKVLSDLPILRISEDSVSVRLKKLVHFGILDYRLVKENGTFCYYTFGENYSRLIDSEGTGSTKYGVQGQPPTGVQGQPCDKDSRLDNTSVRNKSRRFTPPTLQEVEEYAKEKGYDLDCEYFWDYWESIGWKRNGTTIKDWKATLRNWVKRESKTSKPKQKTKFNPLQNIEEYAEYMKDKWEEVF